MPGHQEAAAEAVAGRWAVAADRQVAVAVQVVRRRAAVAAAAARRRAKAGEAAAAERLIAPQLAAEVVGRAEPLADLAAAVAAQALWEELAAAQAVEQAAGPAQLRPLQPVRRSPVAAGVGLAPAAAPGEVAPGVVAPGWLAALAWPEAPAKAAHSRAVAAPPPAQLVAWLLPDPLLP